MLPDKNEENQKIYKKSDMFKFENLKSFSLFGKKTLSASKTAQSKIIKQSKRLLPNVQINKKLNLKLLENKTVFIPQQKKTKQLSCFKFSKSKKDNKLKPKYDYYQLADKLDINKKNQNYRFKFFTEKRKSEKQNFCEVGYKYNSPNMNTKKVRNYFIKNQYFVQKENLNNVAPNSYFPKFKNLSRFKTESGCVFSKDKKYRPEKENFLLLSYERYSSFKKQVMSDVKNSQICVFDKQSKNTNFFVKENYLRLKLPHAHY